MDLFKVIIKEADGKEYLFEVGAGYKTTDEILWDGRVEKGEPPRDLLSLAESNFEAKSQEIKEAGDLIKDEKTMALARLMVSGNKDTIDLLTVLGLK